MNKSKELVPSRHNRTDTQAHTRPVQVLSTKRSKWDLSPTSSHPQPLNLITNNKGKSSFFQWYINAILTSLQARPQAQENLFNTE